MRQAITLLTAVKCFASPVLASKLSRLVVQSRLFSSGKFRTVLEFAAVALRALATKVIIVAEIPPVLSPD